MDLPLAPSDINFPCYPRSVGGWSCLLSTFQLSCKICHCHCHCPVDKVYSPVSLLTFLLHLTVTAVETCADFHQLHLAGSYHCNILYLPTITEIWPSNLTRLILYLAPSTIIIRPWFNLFVGNPWWASLSSARLTPEFAITCMTSLEIVDPYSEYCTLNTVHCTQ